MKINGFISEHYEVASVVNKRLVVFADSRPWMSATYIGNAYDTDKAVIVVSAPDSLRINLTY